MIIDMDIEALNMNYMRGGVKAGEMMIISTPRHSGKSLLNQLYGKISTDAGMFYAPYIPEMKKLKYKFSRAKWYVAEFDTTYYFEVDAWCAQQFGPHPKNPDAWSRWVHRYEDKIHFRDEKDYVLFCLRWS